MKKQNLKFKAGNKLGQWKLVKKIGAGGNGEVWLGENEFKKKSAIKILKKTNEKSYKRFKDEIVIIEKYQNRLNLVPIIDKNLPDKQNDSTENLWFSMELAEPATKFLKSSEPINIINAIIEVSETLKLLHDENISHRDIKPANLLKYNNKFCLGDFGLVKYPGKQEVSIRAEEIGPKWNMPPEMKRNSDKADGIKADIYCLAKTLWILLTDENKGFEGQYSIESIIELKNYQPRIYTTPIDNLLIRCTDNNPLNRPNVSEFIQELKNWKNLYLDYEKRNSAQWLEVQKKLFPTSIPSRVIWESIDDIILVLNVLSSINGLNHMFYPKGGGNDLKGAKKSYETDCIEINMGGLTEIIKPKRLIFESFNESFEWNYFRLETGQLKPSGVYGYNLSRSYEELTELHPKYYVNRDAWDNNEYNGKPIPQTARLVTRILEGDFVIFQKRSMYNKISGTYDGRHNKMDTDKFRQYIKNSVEDFKNRKNI